MHHLNQSKDYAITHNLTPFISMQNHYSLIYREEEREMMPTLKVPDSLKHHSLVSKSVIFSTSNVAQFLGRPLAEDFCPDLSGKREIRNEERLTRKFFLRMLAQDLTD